MSFENQKKYERKHSFVSPAAFALVMSATVASGESHAEGQVSLSQLVQQEMQQVQEGLRSGEITMPTFTYEPLPPVMHETLEIGEFEKFTQAVRQATEQAKTVTTAFDIAGPLYHSDHFQGHPIAGYSVGEVFSDLLPELQEIATDSTVIEDQFKNLTGGGVVTLEFCQEYNLEACIEAFRALEEWRQATMLMPLKIDISQTVIEEYANDAN